MYTRIKMAGEQRRTGTRLPIYIYGESGGHPSLGKENTSSSCLDSGKC